MPPSPALPITALLLLCSNRRETNPPKLRAGPHRPPPTSHGPHLPMTRLRTPCSGIRISITRSYLLPLPCVISLESSSNCKSSSWHRASRSSVSPTPSNRFRYCNTYSRSFSFLVHVVRVRNCTPSSMCCTEPRHLCHSGTRQCSRFDHLLIWQLRMWGRPWQSLTQRARSTPLQAQNQKSMRSLSKERHFNTININYTAALNGRESHLVTI